MTKFSTLGMAICYQLLALCMKRLCKWISDYLGVLVLLSAVAALLFPGTLGRLKPALINPLLEVIMFGMGQRWVRREGSQRLK